MYTCWCFLSFQESRESIVSYYSDAGGGNFGNIAVSGEILFGIDYNYKTGMLEVRIKQCRDLAVADTKKKRSDPYVTLVFFNTFNLKPKLGPSGILYYLKLE